MNRQIVARLGRSATLARLGALALVASPMFARAEVSLAPITAAGVTVGLVGVAVFAVAVGIKVFKWIRSAL